MASSKAPYIAGAALLALLLFSGSANAAEPKGPPGIKPADPKPPEEPPPKVNIPADEPPPVVPGEFGIIPPGLIPSFQLAEKASGIAGLGKFMAVKAWQAARANSPILSPLEAAAWAASHPTLGQDYKNSGDANASFAAMERVTLPKGQVGPHGGVGAYAAKSVWPAPAFMKEWGDIGAAGLFDLLGGVNVYAGIHNDKFTPLLSYHANILFRVDVQLYCAGYYAYRCFNREDIPLFSRAKGDPVKLWAGLGQCWASPSGFIADSNHDAFDRFVERSKECGIDLSTLPIPGFMKAVWPGAAAYYKALGVAP